MDKTFTLTISPDYVKNWTEQDAIREFIQNWIDQRNQEPEAGSAKADLKWLERENKS